MATPVHCTSCDAQLERHCESAGCRWLRCPNLLHCDWRIYDLDHGTRLDKRNHLERLGAPPAAPDQSEYDGA